MTMHAPNNFMPPIVRARGEGILGSMGEYFSGAYELQGMGMPPRVDAYRSGSLGEQVSTMPRYAAISGMGEYFEGYGAVPGGQAGVYGIAAIVGAALGAGVGMVAKTKLGPAAAIGAVAAIAAPLIMVPIINAFGE